MKRFIPILLAAALLLGACGSNPERAPQESNDPGRQESGAPAGDGEAAEEEGAQEEVRDSDAPAEPLARGQWDGDTFINTYTDITFRLPEGWVASTNEELAAIMGVDAELLQDSGLQFDEKLLELQNVYDMMAHETATGSNVIVMYENLALTAGGTSFGEQDYLELLKSQITAEEIMNYQLGDVYDQEIGGNRFAVLPVEASDMGVSQYHCVRKSDKCMVYLILTVLGDRSVDDVIGYFDSAAPQI